MLQRRFATADDNEHNERGTEDYSGGGFLVSPARLMVVFNSSAEVAGQRTNAAAPADPVAPDGRAESQSFITRDIRDKQTLARVQCGADKVPSVVRAVNTLRRWPVNARRNDRRLLQQKAG